MKSKRSEIYKKLYGITFLIVIFIIATLDIFIIRRYYNSEKSNILYINQKLVEEVNREINNFVYKTKTFTDGIYNDSRIIEDVIDFLNMERISYFENKLDKFSSSRSNTYIGIESFIKSCFLSDKNLYEVSFISENRQTIDIFNKKNQIMTVDVNEYPIYNEHSISNIICTGNKINFIVRLNNPITYKLVGSVIFSFSMDEIDSILKRYDNNQELMIWDTNNNVVYDSVNLNRKGNELSVSMLVEIPQIKSIEKDYYINRKDNQTSLIIMGKVLKSTLKNISPSFLGSLIFIDFVVFALSQIIIYLKLKKINSRLSNIMTAMDEVKNGNLAVSIPVTSENDELSYIATNFNEMCVKLNSHIERSYLAEIEQHKAEMIALQNQINPHFLYNTLESIRMKAICNNDREVGKMLYSLAFLFRTQLKESNIIPINREIDYCKKYIDIFKFRYEGKFQYFINCPEELMDKEIVKFSLQPLIENYFIHGIKLDQEDNFLTINISKSKDGKFVNILIIDNGTGIEEDKIIQLNSMVNNRKQTGKSIGVFNANERIVMAFGDECGIRFENSNQGGTSIIVRIPNRDFMGGNNNA